MNFENLYWLFGSNTYNRDIIRMDLDEASYLFRVIKTLKKNYTKINIIEIGTYKGGSTILMLGAGATVTTVDNYSSKTFKDYRHNPVEDVVSMAKDINCEHKLNIINGDSRTYPNRQMKCDLLFIDGDHSYEGVKADYRHWIPTLRGGGHLIFHDSCVAREGATGIAGVMKFMSEVNFKKHVEVGSLTHFIKKAK